MGLTEIILIIIGAVILVTSFVLPAGKNGKNETPVPKIDEKQIRNLIEKEIQEAKGHINDMVDETLTYSMEKTERAMERLTNEKIMAVSEYSEQVLEAINKNHQEVMFLYDMLNDKHENLVNTVSEASGKAQEIKQIVQDMEITVKEVSDSIVTEGAQTRKMEDVQRVSEVGEVPEVQAENVMLEASQVQNSLGESERQEASKGEEGLSQMLGEAEFIPIAPKKVEMIHNAVPEADAAVWEEPKAETAVGEEDRTYNNNEKILRLHRLGMSQTAIAKELGLGVGEVKLVIDLFEQA